MFINGIERCHTTDVPSKLTLFFKSKQSTIYVLKSITTQWRVPLSPVYFNKCQWSCYNVLLECPWWYIYNNIILFKNTFFKFGPKMFYKCRLAHFISWYILLQRFDKIQAQFSFYETENCFIWFTPFWPLVY